MYLYLTKIDSNTYRLDPTPESIALCDYFLQNGVFDGNMYVELNLQEGMLYIDDVNVTNISICYRSDDGVFYTPDSYWEPSKDYFGLSAVKEIVLEDNDSGKKGTIIVWNDD